MSFESIHVLWLFQVWTNTEVVSKWLEWVHCTDTKKQWNDESTSGLFGSCLSATFFIPYYIFLQPRTLRSQWTPYKISSLFDDVLTWLKSYLAGRSQQVCINGELSNSRGLVCGFSKGPKIGPRIYKKYTEPLGPLAQLLWLFYHFYADDSQLWKTASSAGAKQLPCDFDEKSKRPI